MCGDVFRMATTESVRFPKQLAKRLHDRSAKTGFRRSDIIRAAVAKLLSENPDETGAAILKFRTEAAK